MGSDKRKSRGKGSKRGTEASRADKYSCYERSVQETEADVPFVERAFRREFGRAPRTLREDFCGTAAMACTWVKHHRENRAVGIDLDPEPLEWGRKHNVGALNADQASRVKLIEGNVLDVASSDIDATIAFNFSYFIFRKRAELLRYFRQAHSTLAPEGIFVLDVYGGADAQRTMTETRNCPGGFKYVWDQHSFDPIQHRAVNYIHFKFKDGSKLRRAFRYEWRLWTLPELRDVLEDAGFSKVITYWEGTDKDGEPNGVFIRRKSAEDDPAWIAYLVAVR